MPGKFQCKCIHMLCSVCMDFMRKKVVQVFSGFWKAYEIVDRSKLCQCLLGQWVWWSYRDLTCEVKFDMFSGSISVTRGLRQGCIVR